MSEHIFTLPDLGEGMVEAEVSEWHVQVGDVVTEDQQVVDMLTDKAAVEVPAPVSGVIIKLGGEPGDIIKVGAPLVVFDTSGAAVKPAKSEAPAPVKAPERAAATPIVATEPVAPAPAVAAPSSNGALPVADTSLPRPETLAMGPVVKGPVGDAKVMTSPAIRRLAMEHQIDLGNITGTGARGRITRKDFDDFIAAKQQKPTVPGPARRSGAKEIKVIGMRRLIAQRMVASKTEVPHFSYIEEIDVTELEALRQQLNEQYAPYAVKFSYLPLLVQAVSKALTRFPQCNALYDKERNVIVQHAPVHVGVATQTPDGLKVPVVRHAEAMTLPVLAQQITAVAKAARDGSASKGQLTGSTITITSLGKLGGIASTPVINQPEVAILGVNRAVERPMIVNGGIQIRRMMNISTSFDHRFVDGYDAAEFVQAIKEMLEDPRATFAAG